MRMRFRLLGPVEVEVAGEVRSRSLRRRERCLLAVLLLEANRMVPVDRLIELLWDGEPPERARAGIHSHVSRLRAAIVAAGNGGTQVELALVGDGYRLGVDLQAVDAHRFSTLLERAAGTADPYERIRDLRVALDLWRGPAMANAASDWLRRRLCADLEERRLAATEDLYAASVALRRERAILPDLAQTAGAHPGRESLAALHMRALYQAGRKAEALEVYGRARRHQVEQLGLDPGPALRDLHQAILRDELSIPEAPRQAPPPPDPPFAVPTPQQLPADVVGFTGRTEQLARLEGLLGRAGGAARVVVIAGPAGTGKSALAVHAAHRVAGEFPDGQLYVDLAGATEGVLPLPPAEVLGRFLRALGLPPGRIPADLAEAAALFRSESATRRLLVVLDNAHDAHQVAPLLPGAAGCAALVTSRRMPASLPSAHQLRLSGLPGEEAVRLLASLAGEDRVAAEPDAAAEVAGWCANLPLALRIAGGRLAARPGRRVRVLADRLADTGRRLDELELPGLGVRASLAASHRELRDSADGTERQAAAAFGWLGVPDGQDITAAAAAHLLDLPEPAAEAALERLVDAGLLECPGDDRYRLHDLLRLYAREHAATAYPAPSRAVPLIRMFGWYAATAWHTLELLRPGDHRAAAARPEWVTGGLTFPGEAAALAWLEAERANLMSAARQAAATPGVPPAMAVQLAHALFALFVVRCYWSELLEVNRIALRVAAETGDRAGQAQVLSDLGVAYGRQEQHEDAMACLRDSLSSYQELGDLSAQARVLTNLGNVHCHQGEVEDGMACYRNSMTIRRQLGDDYGEANCWINLGGVHFQRGQYEEALACHERGLALRRRIGDRHGVSVALADLGETYLCLGRHGRALACLREGLEIQRALGDVEGQADILRCLGVLHRERGESEDAVARLREGLAIARQSGLRRRQAECLRDLGSTLDCLGQGEQARAQWREALAIYEALRAPEAGTLREWLEVPDQSAVDEAGQSGDGVRSVSGSGRRPSAW